MTGYMVNNHGLLMGLLMINGEKWVYPWLFGWWFGTCLSIQLGMSSSQLTNYYFSEG